MSQNEEQVESLFEVIACAKEFVSMWNECQRGGSSTETKAQVHVRKTVAKAAYNISLEKLMIAYAKASELGVSEDLLMHEIHVVLPKGLEFTIKIEHS